MKDGAQDDLVGAALQDDLNIPLQQTGLCEEFGLGRELLRVLRAVGFPLERGALARKEGGGGGDRITMK